MTAAVLAAPLAAPCGTVPAAPGGAAAAARPRRAERRAVPVGLVRLALATLLWLAAGALAQAQSPAGAPDFRTVLSQYDAEAGDVEARLAEGDADQAALQSMLETLLVQREAIGPFVEQVEAQAAPVRRQLDALGPPPEDATEAESVANEREALQARLGELEALRRRLEQADARAAALIDRLNAERRRLLTDRLLTRQRIPLAPAVLTEAAAGLATLGIEIGAEVRRRLADRAGEPAELLFRLTGPLAAVLATGAALYLLRRRVLKRLLAYLDQPMAASRKIIVGAGLTAARLFLPSLVLALVLAAALASRLFGPLGQEVLEGLARTALILIAASALAAAYFSPLVAQLRLSNLDDASAQTANSYVIVLAALYGLDTLFVQNAEDLDLPIEAVQLLNLAFLTLGGLALWRFERAVASYRPEAAEPAEPVEEDADAERPSATAPPLFAIGRLLLIAVAVASPLLALAGYFAASRFAFYNPLVTAALIGVFVLGFAVVRELVEALVRRASEPAAARAKGPIAPAAAGMPAAGPAPEASRLRLIPVLVGFVLVCAAVPLIAMIWGAERGDLIAGWQAVRDGVAIGEVTLAPTDIGVFVLAFGVVYLAVRVLQAILSRSVLPLTSLDAGGRAAISAGVGYLGFVVAFLIGIGAAGLDLSSLAIVAGALSVGIGFGLQAVVNNFVSGLILLIERPIKPGDWVELPSGMGYVQKINVRSTVIETFDRASLIVPNSELISATVINWTHTNLNGRIIVGVRAAFGSDPRAVERILLDVARKHPLVLRRPQPFVLFRGYNDYAMLFEVRAVLRDVNWILNAQSDFYFEIHRRFADAGIEVPVQSSRVTIERAGGDAFQEEAIARPGLRAVPAASRPPAGPGEPAIAGGDGDGR
ncbi:MAG: mechanosensitive ion channel domain-containing protein [Paracoccaceae bacterium]